MYQTFSIQLSEHSDYERFNRIEHLISSKYEIEWLDKLTGIDQRYWDFKIANETITLHLEHFCGISLYTANETLNHERACEITKEIADYLLSKED